MPVNDVGNKQFRNDLVSFLKAAWGVLEDIHDHEQNGVAVVESWRMDELEEELGKWGAWFSLSTRRKRHGKQCIKKAIMRKMKSYGVRDE